MPLIKEKYHSKRLLHPLMPRVKARYIFYRTGRKPAPLLGVTYRAWETTRSLQSITMIIR
jgi:hypothetical protein